MARTAKYQYGNLMRRPRKLGPDVWQFRWVENGRLKSVLVGTVERYPAKADAERAVEHLRLQINEPVPQRAFHAVTVGGLIDYFMVEYAPKRCRKRTQKNYLSLFNNHIRPKWGKEQIRTVKTLAVEEWLENYPASRPVKSHVRSLMHTLYQAALRWEMADKNPVDLVRQSSKRLKIPRVLTPVEFKALLTTLDEPYKTMVVTIACLGLRVSELLGLQWGDLDFENLTVRIQRSYVQGEVNLTKTEASESTLPLDTNLAEVLLAHKTHCAPKTAEAFLFAGAKGMPRWAEIMLTDHIKPAAVKAGIGNLGWHTFRHTYATLLHSLGTPMGVQKELLRHSNIQTTMNLYTQAVSEQKRDAATKVARVLWER